MHTIRHNHNNTSTPTRFRPSGPSSGSAQLNKQYFSTFYHLQYVESYHKFFSVIYSRWIWAQYLEQPVCSNVFTVLRLLQLLFTNPSTTNHTMTNLRQR